MSGKFDFYLSIAHDKGLCALVKRCNGYQMYITTHFHSVDNEPICPECEEPFLYDEMENCYICECGEKMSVMEYVAKCEFTNTEIYDFEF